jgi:hypothetical protein
MSVEDSLELSILKRVLSDILKCYEVGASSRMLVERVASRPIFSLREKRLVLRIATILDKTSELAVRINYNT